jgi:hypothetical protein
MKTFKETTDWEWPNHVYFLNDSRDKMYGYVRSEDGVVQLFNKPYRFHVRGRKFKEVANTWNVAVDEAEPVTGRTWTVQGSKGDAYTVTEDRGSWTCTCSGFKFRNRCRHVEEISSTVS